MTGAESDSGALSCALAEGLLAARAVGALPPAREQALARHLGACAACRRLGEDPLMSMPSPAT